MQVRQAEKELKRKQEELREFEVRAWVVASIYSQGTVGSVYSQAHYLVPASSKTRLD